MGKPLARTDVDDISQFIHARNIVCSRQLLDLLAANHGPVEIKLKPIEVPKSEIYEPAPVVPARNLEPGWWHTMWFGNLVDLWAPLPGDPLTIAFIQAVVAKNYGLTRADLMSAKRSHKYIEPRHVAMYLAKTLTTKSLPEIGRRFGGRDHTSALYAVQKIAARCISNSEFALKIAALKSEICS